MDVTGIDVRGECLDNFISEAVQGESSDTFSRAHTQEKKTNAHTENIFIVTNVYI